MNRSAIFEAEPWRTIAAPPSCDLVGMLGEHEASMFHHLARDWFRGEGTIVDAGSFLGRSATCFATGLRDNPRFDAARHRVHCFDDFACHDEVAPGIVREHFGDELAIGDSTRPFFERQVAPVRDLLEVHAGDFHAATWTGGPIEILMVDVAKTVALHSRLLEHFFPALQPGRSLVIHQDYHHPQLSYAHVVMEFFGDRFELVAPRVDDSAVFRLRDALPPPDLARAIAYDFDLTEQFALLERAIARNAPADRPWLELSRVTLLAESGTADPRSELDRVEALYADAMRHDHGGYFRRVRDLADTAAAERHAARGEHLEALTITDALLGRGTHQAKVFEVRAIAAFHTGRRDAAEAALTAARELTPAHGRSRASFVRILRAFGHDDEAETVVLEDLRSPVLEAAARP
ncbi:MAG: class I SAM-dependent methyltransferase, partial [Planctomycetes bacterium]|nr:class I SAM-dependent methyltransferase [Planctomycetota bacterium]